MNLPWKGLEKGGHSDTATAWRTEDFVLSSESDAGGQTPRCTSLRPQPGAGRRMGSWCWEVRVFLGEGDRHILLHFLTEMRRTSSDWELAY